MDKFLEKAKKVLDYMKSLNIKWVISDFNNKSFIVYGWSKDHLYDVLLSFGANILDDSDITGADALILWGASFLDAPIVEEFMALNRPIILVEDGFIRSLFSVQFGEKGISFIFDTLGLHFASYLGNSILIDTLNSDHYYSDATLKSARDCMSDIVNYDITKYNYGSRNIEYFNSYSKKKILVLDQVKGDMSVTLSNVSDNVFYEMLHDAIREHPNDDIFIKIHPEQLTGVRNGYFTNDFLLNIQSTFSNVHVLDVSFNSIALLKSIDKVYCVSTQMGFEALLCGKEVFVYGCPYYAGWGFTKDKQKISRNRERSIEEIFYSAYIENTVYFSNKNNSIINFNSAIEYILEKRSAFIILDDIFKQQQKLLETSKLASCFMQNAVSRLLYDTGSSFNWNECIIQNVAIGQKRFIFDVVNFTKINKIRLDLINQPAKIQFISGTANLKDGEIYKLTQFIHNAEVIGNVYDFKHPDPQFIFDIPDELADRINSFEFEYLIEVYNKQNVLNFLADSINNLKITYLDLESTRLDLESTRLDLENTKNELLQCYASKSWKLTSPLRTIVKLLKSMVRYL